MSVSRRRFTVLGCVGLSSLAISSAHGDHDGAEWLVSAGTDATTSETLLVTAQRVTGKASITPRVTRTGFRGHDTVAHPRKPGHVVMFARRPGFQAIEVNVLGNTSRQAYELAPDRQAFGHGVFSADGRRLFSCEGAIRSGEGLIVVRDALNYEVIAEWSSGGIGPHELILLADKKTLAVANGGLLTRPETGRQVLNLDSMSSNLSYVDSRSGALIDTVWSVHPRASIRHLDARVDGTVVMGMQFQRMKTDDEKPVQLIALHRQGEQLKPIELPEQVLLALDDYVGSVRVSGSGRYAGFTSPRGDLFLSVDLERGVFQSHYILHDVCGLAATDRSDDFVLTNSSGDGRIVDASTGKERLNARFKTPGIRWDNHLRVAKSGV